MSGKIITGYYGCRCHPFESWDECERAHNQMFNVGDRVRSRHTGILGEVSKICEEKGFVIVKEGDRECDHVLNHVACLISEATNNG
jgi:hypothetical protein